MSIRLGIGVVNEEAATVVTADDDAAKLVVDDEVTGSALFVDVEIVDFTTCFGFFSTRCFEGVRSFDPAGSFSTLDGIGTTAAGIGAADTAEVDVVDVDDDVVVEKVGVDDMLVADVVGGGFGGFGVRADVDAGVWIGADCRCSIGCVPVDDKAIPFELVD